MPPSETASGLVMEGSSRMPRPTSSTSKRRAQSMARVAAAVPCAEPSMATSTRRITASPGDPAVEGKVQAEHVHPGLTEEAELSALDVLLDQASYLRWIHPPRPGHPRDLVERGGWTDVGIEATARRRREVDRDGRRVAG